MTTITVLVASESSSLKDEIERHLSKENYRVIGNYETFLKRQTLYKIDLILFDNTTLRNNAVFNQLKTHNSLVPIIALVEQGNVDSAVQLMRSGVITVLTLPINKQPLYQAAKDAITQSSTLQHDRLAIQQAIELLQSVRTNYGFVSESRAKYELNASLTYDDGFLQLGELVINNRQEKAFYRKTPVDITPTQFRLLSYLGEAKGRIIPFEELYFHLHGTQLDRAAARIALSAHLSNLRTSLKEVGCKDHLVNVRGRGYLFEIPEKTNSHTSKINLDLILEQLPIILWTTDTKLRLTSILGASLNDLNLKTEHLIGLTPSEFFQTNTDDSLPFTAYRRALKGESTSYEQDLRGRIFHMHIEPYYNGDDKVIGCIGIAFDMSERKAAEEIYGK